MAANAIVVQLKRAEWEEWTQPGLCILSFSRSQKEMTRAGAGLGGTTDPKVKRTFSSLDWRELVFRRPEERVMRCVRERTISAVLLHPSNKQLGVCALSDF